MLNEITKPIIGLHANRLYPQAGNPREVAFAEQWEKEKDILSALFVVPCSKDDPGSQPCWSCGYARYPLGRVPTDRDRQVAATVIQWLGSNVGMDFIGQALERCGYERPRHKE